jgi:hypothetical protein
MLPLPEESLDVFKDEKLQLSVLGKVGRPVDDPEDERAYKL